MNKKGVLVVLSGFSGAGKGTIMKALLSKYNNYALSISATTRKPRQGETEGVEYFYKSEDEFISMISEKRLIEYAKYVNNYYGTPKEYVIDRLNEGKDVILEIEIQGARQVKNMMPEAILIFVTPPTASELKHRLIGRNTEDLDVIEKRLERAYEESEGIDEYDYVLINDEVDDCVQKLHNIIQSEHMKINRNTELISNIREEVKIFKK